MRPPGRLTSSTKTSAKSYPARGCSVNKPPPSTSASHRHQTWPKLIDEKQSVISRLHCFGYDESKNTKGNTHAVTSPHFLEPSYLYKSCLISLKVSTHAHKNISCAVQSRLLSCKCIACCLAGPREVEFTLSCGQAAVSPKEIFFQLFQIAPTHTQSLCFVIKTRRKITSKGILPISLSTYSTTVIFLKKQTPQNWPSEQQSSQEADLITSFFKIHPALHTCRFQQQS